MLYSAVGVVLPGNCTAPPMTTTSLVHVLMRGSRRKANARLVSGPVHTTLISPGSASNRSTRYPGASSSALRCETGNRAPPSPSTPCQYTASTNGASSGQSAPATTGTSVAPSQSSTRSVFAVASSSPTLPQLV